MPNRVLPLIIMGTPSPLIASVVNPAASSSALLPAPPCTLDEYPSTTGPFFTQVDLNDDNGIRYMVRRHLMDQNHQLLEDLNFGDLFSRRETTGDVVIMCIQHQSKMPLHFITTNTDYCEYVPVKAHKFVLVRSSTFFQKYFESLHEHPVISCILTPNIEISTMKLMLQLFYTGQVMMKFDEMVPFWGAAGNLQIRRVDPSYNWTYYIETLEPVSDSDHADFSNTIALESPFVSGGATEPIDLPEKGQHEHQESQPMVTVTISQTSHDNAPSIVDVSSNPNSAATVHPVVILRPLGHPTLSLRNITRTVDAPIFYLTDQRTPPPAAPTAEIIEQPIVPCATTNINTIPSSPILSSAEDLTMQMLAVNPDQSCRLYYSAASENEDNSNSFEQPITNTSVANTTSSPQTSSCSTTTLSQSTHVRPSPSPTSSIKNMVMCPVCLIVIEQEKFEAHKKMCNVYGNPPETNLFTCGICSKSFATKHGLAAHKPFHTKKKNNNNNNKNVEKVNNGKPTMKKSKLSEKQRPPTLTDNNPSCN